MVFINLYDIGRISLKFERDYVPEFKEGKKTRMKKEIKTVFSNGNEKLRPGEIQEALQGKNLQCSLVEIGLLLKEMGYPKKRTS